MIQGIDHIVILVPDLDQATEKYTSLGFTVVPGGEHTGGQSHNALVAFADGSYLELIAFKGPIPRDHFFYREGVTEGLITYALLPGDIEADNVAARERGIAYAGPRPGGRLRPDGTRLEWQIATPPGHDLPFLCGDVTPRELRVPGGDVHKHKNGATGISTLTVSVKNVAESAQRYTALLGTRSAMSPTSAGFKVGNATILLIQSNDKALPYEGPTALSLTESGGGEIDLLAALPNRL